MREIKFRAWDGELKEMIGPEEVLSCSFIGLNGEWLGLSDLLKGEGGFELMQYTGLRDKNGVEIYEGDILKAVDGYTGLIVYRTESAQFVGFNIGKEFTEEEFDTLYTVNGSFNSAEVIGNRFENPELLEAK